MTELEACKIINEIAEKYNLKTEIKEAPGGFATTYLTISETGNGINDWLMYTPFFHTKPFAMRINVRRSGGSGMSVEELEYLAQVVKNAAAFLSEIEAAHIVIDEEY